MRTHSQIHTLGAVQYKTHGQFLRKLKNFKWALWSEKYGSIYFVTLKHSKNKTMCNAAHNSGVLHSANTKNIHSHLLFDSQA